MLLGPDRLRDYLHRELLYKVIVSKLTEGIRSDKEKAFKLMDYVYTHVVINVQTYEEILDKHPLSDLKRGVGVCDQLANTLITLARKAHIKGRLIFLKGDSDSSRHSVCDLYINGEFRMFDPTFNFVYINNEKEIATFDDIQKHNIEPGVLVLNSGLADPFAPRESYLLLFSPTFPPKNFRRNYEQDKVRFILSRIMDLYYDIFGDVFLTLYQEAYFKLSGQDDFIKARYKHLASRYDSAGSGYDHIIKNSDNEYERTGSMFFKNQIYWDMGMIERSISGFEKLLRNFPDLSKHRLALESTPLFYDTGKRRLIVLIYLGILHKIKGDLSKSEYYLDILRSPSKKLPD